MVVEKTADSLGNSFSHSPTQDELESLGPDSTHDLEDDVRQENVIAKDENRNVFRLRLLVILVLVASTVGVAFGVYRYVSHEEQTDFENTFEEDSDKVLEAIGSTLDLTLGSVDAFLVSLVSFAQSTNSSWPFVTFPNYAVRLAKLRSISKAVLVSQYHYVTGDEREKWEKYSVENDAWVQNGIDTQKTDENFHGKIVTDYWTRGDIHESGDPYYAPGPYLPKWQQSPVIPIYAPYNWDAMTFSSLADSLHIVQGDRKIAISDVSNIPNISDPESVRHAKGNNHFIKDYVGDDEDETEPFSDLYFPILDYAADYVTIPKNASQAELGNFVGVFAITFYWRDLMKDILPTESNGIVVAVKNSCGETFTYQVNGPETVYLGEGDLHEKEFDDYLWKTAKLTELGRFKIDDRTYSGLDLSEKGCNYVVELYPSSEMKGNFSSRNPLYFTLGAVAIFSFTSLVFFSYDYMVERRQAKVMESAVKTNNIVSALFPSNVRDRLFENDKPSKPTSKFEHNKTRLKKFLSDTKNEQKASFGDSQANSSHAPIADLFPDCTVLFSDISGFTAWSSVRDPTQVFTLLEAMYGAFDDIAKRRGVFKVETIGDAYVAVTGLPEPRKDHAIVMCKFARDCLIRMLDILRDLETTLGPGTANLRMRFGLHSGAVTAGVLRGQKSRFQLFGDTVNTASRMESTGVANRIQVSDTTAKLLMDAGKSSWVVPRDGLVEAKGKGKMQTYWVEQKMMAGRVSQSEDSGETPGMPDDKTKRLVDWNTDVLSGLVKKIVANRLAKGVKSKRQSSFVSLPNVAPQDGQMPLDEVVESVELPSFDEKAYLEQQDDIQLDKNVVGELRDYVVAIAALYNDNPFHSFEHASHVGMSTAKMLSRIVKPEEVLSDTSSYSNGADLGRSLHQHTFGIASDPLTQFACVFSALIHDVDHPGIPNTRLVEENSDLAVRYKNKSVAEQNSVDVGWNLFLSEAFTALREAICPTAGDLKSFRQLVVNIVMATDILDPELKGLRNERWETAFSASQEQVMDQPNLKATMVLEHLIQASDVAHTMQHWHIYQRWNECLFDEMYLAYRAGRAAKDPGEFWYEGELGFFDNCILPLARKLQECGVFGVSSEEYLDYAIKNREEWAARGKDVVQEMVAKRKYDSQSSR